MIPLGGPTPATLLGSADTTGYTLRLFGPIALARLLALGNALPPFGDGLAAILPKNRPAGPIRLDLTAHRPWTLQTPSTEAQTGSQNGSQNGSQTSFQIWIDTLTPASPSIQHRPHPAAPPIHRR